MLLILKAIPDLLGNVGHLVFNRTVLPKAFLLLSDDVVFLQVPYQARRVLVNQSVSLL